MTEETAGTYCQNCFTWNPGERETCRKCGTRLFIVTGDQAWEDEEDSEVQEDLDEHLLERITILEESLRRVETYLETVSDQLGRLERSEVMLRNGLMSLVQHMEEKGQLDAKGFSERWEDLVEENLQLIGARELFTRYRARILPLAKPKSMAQLKRALLETAAFLENAQLVEAAQRLGQALSLDPKNYELLFTVASLMEVIQDDELAETLARKVVTLSPRHFEAWMLLARLLHDDPDSTDEAVEALRRAMALRPDEIDPRVLLGQLLLDEEDLQGALEAAQDATNLQRSGETLQLMGQVLLARGESAKAIGILKEASGYLPGDLVVRELLAESYLLADERPKAFSILEDLLRQHPGDPELLLLLDAEDPAQLKSARGGRPYSRRLLDQADELMTEGKVGEVEALIKKAKRKEPSQRAEFMDLQMAMRRNPARSLKAAMDFAVSNRHPRLCFLALRMVMDHYMAEESEELMVFALDQYLSAHPKSSGAWEAALIRQAYHLMSGQMDEAGLVEVQRLYASPLPGQESRVRTLLGQCLLDLKRPEAVVDLLENILKTEPTLVNHFQLGSALAALGEKDDALAVLQDGLDADRGDLPEGQVTLLKKKIEGLIAELEQGGRSILP